MAVERLGIVARNHIRRGDEDQVQIQYTFQASRFVEARYGFNDVNDDNISTVEQSL